MISANGLVTELNRLGVPFLTGGEPGRAAASLSPEELVVGLTTQPDARLRLALIPLLLVHPELVAVVSAVLPRLSP